MERESVDELYERFWKRLITDKDGNIDIQAVKNELYDFYDLLQQVPKVYEHVTGGSLTKVLTKAEHIISAADEHYKNVYDYSEEE